MPLEYELRFLQAAVEELKTYLLSSQVYWPISVRAPRGTSPYPRFSLGWLLLYRRKSSQYNGSPELDAVLAQIGQLHDQWQTAWANKAAQEFSARLTLWRGFFNDYRAEPAAHAARYPYEVQRRTLLELLRAAAREIPPAELDLLRGLDAALRLALIPGAFVDDPDYAAAFPPDQFWFLYGSLKS
jgi:hypothetical protein